MRRASRHRPDTAAAAAAEADARRAPDDFERTTRVSFYMVVEYFYREVDDGANMNPIQKLSRPARDARLQANLRKKIEMLILVKNGVCWCEGDPNEVCKLCSRRLYAPA